MKNLLLAMFVALLMAGWGVDLSVPVEETKRRAEEGDSFSQYKLGEAYYFGDKGVPQDYAEAAKWYRKAAEQGAGATGASLAMAEMAGLYTTGKGVPRDHNEAAKWLHKAALLGDPALL